MGHDYDVEGEPYLHAEGLAGVLPVAHSESAVPKGGVSVTIDDEKQQIVLRTSNKKYFKRIDIPDLKRVDPPLSLQEERLSWDYKHNTVVISYQRPAEIAKAEAEAIRAAEKNSQGLV